MAATGGSSDDGSGDAGSCDEAETRQGPQGGRRHRNAEQLGDASWHEQAVAAFYNKAGPAKVLVGTVLMAAATNSWKAMGTCSHFSS
jgi:hypothetical protein